MPLLKPPRSVRRAWSAWQQIDAMQGLLSTIRSLGWVVLGAVTYGGAVVGIVISLALTAADVLAPWAAYVVAIVAVVVATIPNYLMWRYRREGRGASVAPSEELILVAPTDRGKVSSPVNVRGYANVMEGNVVIERLQSSGDWSILGNTTAGLGRPGELFLFSTTISMPSGKHHLRVCAEPFMADERSFTGCVELDIEVV